MYDEFNFAPEDIPCPELDEDFPLPSILDAQNEEFNFTGEVIEDSPLSVSVSSDSDAPFHEEASTAPAEEPRLGYSFWGKCRFCGCQHFVTAPDSVAARCKCGHMDFNHDKHK